MSTVKVCDHCGATNRDTGDNFPVDSVSFTAQLVLHLPSGGCYPSIDYKDLHLCPQCRAVLLEYINGFFRLKEKARGLRFRNAPSPQDKEDSGEPKKE